MTPTTYNLTIQALRPNIRKSLQHIITWTESTMSVAHTLFQWYVAYFEESDRKSQSSGIRDVLGYANTAVVPKQMTFDEFQDGLRHPWRTSSVKQSWINRFIAGHEQETKHLSKEVQSFLHDCSQPVPAEFGDPTIPKLKPPHFTRSMQSRDSAERG